jgi:hypothetical protein
MAFNPFTSFRKYQRFWMATLVLVSMFTFILCSGIGSGGFEDMIFKYFGGRRGPEFTQMYGRTVYRVELDELKQHRQIANEYMHLAADASLKGLEEYFKSLSKDDTKDAKRAADRMKLTALMSDLDEVVRRQRFFEGDPNKLDDLVDFMLWQKQADKLGIQLQDNEVWLEVKLAVHAFQSGMDQRDDWRGLYYAIRYSHNNVNERILLEALRQEFRVRIARKVLLLCYADSILHPDALGRHRAAEVRMPPTPEQLLSFFRQNRTPLRITLVPIRADNKEFLAKVKEPTETALKGLFQDHRTQKFDPTLAVPGFEQPNEAKVAYVTADPKGKYYQGLARAVAALEVAPPVVWTPTLPGLGEALALAGRQAASEASLQRNYENLRRKDPYAYVQPYLFEPYPATPLYERESKWTPVEAAAAVGSALQPGLIPNPFAGHLATAGVKLGDKLAPVLEAEARRRAPVGLTLFLSAFSPAPETLPLAMGMTFQAASWEPQWLPLPLVEKKLREQIDDQRAAGWAAEVMDTIRPELKQVSGNPKGFNIRLDQLQRRYPGLEVHSSDGFRNRFDIGQDPNLASLRESFENLRDKINDTEGRTKGTERYLGEDDFYRLFFGGEAFSVGNTGLYDPKLWPPLVHPDPRQQRHQAIMKGASADAAQPKPINLWEVRNRDQRFIYWRVDGKPAHPPESLDDMRAEVERAYKLQQSRELALARAREVAEAVKRVQLVGGDPDAHATMLHEAKRLGETPLLLRDVTPLVKAVEPPADSPLPRLKAPEWIPYHLPRVLTQPQGPIPYPTADMAKDLLALRDLTAPIQIKPETAEGGKRDVDSLVKQLNNLNKELFDKSQGGKFPAFHQVQVLTNRPRTIFYVAQVTQESPAVLGEFVLAWRQAFHGGLENFENSLIGQAQKQLARDYEQRFIRQMRRDAGLNEDLSGLDRQGFD